MAYKIGNDTVIDGSKNFSGNILTLSNSLATSQVNQGEVLLDNTIATSSPQTITLTRAYSGGLINAGFRGFRIIGRGLVSLPTIRYVDQNSNQNASIYFVWGLSSGPAVGTGYYNITNNTYLNTGLSVYNTISNSFPHSIDVYMFRRMSTLTTGCTGYGFSFGANSSTGNGSVTSGIILSYYFNNASSSQNFEGIYFSGNVLAQGSIRIYGVI